MKNMKSHEEGQELLFCVLKDSGGSLQELHALHGEEPFKHANHEGHEGA